MSVIHEPTRAERWIYTTLSGDPTLVSLIGGARIYANVAPQGIAYPFVVYQMMSPGTALYGNGPNIIWQRMVYLVKAVTKGTSASSLQTIVDRINDLLHAERGAVSDAQIDYSIKLRPFVLPTLEGNVQYQQLGSEFEIAVRADGV